jgi:hypothetical protein
LLLFISEKKLISVERLFAKALGISLEFTPSGELKDVVLEIIFFFFIILLDIL